MDRTAQTKIQLVASTARKLFRFRGRMGRLQAWGYTFLLLAIYVPCFACGYILLRNGVQGASLLLICIGVSALFWGGTAITVQRLHDLGYAGAHAIWIVGLGWACNFWGGFGSPIGVVLNLVWFGVGAWLVIAPGQKHENAYGPPARASDASGPGARGALTSGRLSS